MNFQSRLKDRYGTLTPSFRRIIDYILENKHDSLSLSALELGRRGGASAASVIRLSRRLGYRSFEEMKMDIASGLAQISETDKVDTIVAPTDAVRELSAKIYNRAQSVLAETLQLLDFDALARAIALMKKADSLYIFAVGESALPALDLQQKFLKINKKVFFSTDAHLGLASSIFASPRDAVLAISYSGRTKEVNRAVERARENGAQAVAITRLGVNKLAQTADVVLNIPDQEREIRIGAISSTFAEFLIADILFLGIVQDSFAEVERCAKERLKLIRLLKD